MTRWPFLVTDFRHPYGGDRRAGPIIPAEIRKRSGTTSRQSHPPSSRHRPATLLLPRSWGVHRSMRVPPSMVSSLSTFLVADFRHPPTSGAFQLRPTAQLPPQSRPGFASPQSAESGTPLVYSWSTASAACRRLYDSLAGILAGEIPGGPVVPSWCFPTSGAFTVLHHPWRFFRTMRISALTSALTSALISYPLGSTQPIPAERPCRSGLPSAIAARSATCTPPASPASRAHSAGSPLARKRTVG